MLDESVARASLISWLRSGKPNTVQSVLQVAAVGDPLVFVWCVAAVLDAMLPLIVDDLKSGPARAIQFAYDVVRNGMPPEKDRPPYLEITLERAASIKVPAEIKGKRPTWEQDQFYEYFGQSARYLVTVVFLSNNPYSAADFQYEKWVRLLSNDVEKAVRNSGVAEASGDKSPRAAAEWTAGVVSFAIENYPHFINHALKPKSAAEIEENKRLENQMRKERESSDLINFRNLIETSSGPFFKQRSRPIRYKIRDEKKRKNDPFSR